MGLFDRLSDGIGRLGQAAGQAIDESRIQMELMRARRRKDNAARDLGYLVYRISQGAIAAAGEQEALVRRITETERTIERLESEVKQLKHRPDPGDALDTREPATDAGTPSDAAPGSHGEPDAPEPATTAPDSAAEA